MYVSILSASVESAWVSGRVGTWIGTWVCAWLCGSKGGCSREKSKSAGSTEISSSSLMRGCDVNY